MADVSHRHKFPATLRLKSKKQIASLFTNKVSVFNHPLLLKYNIEPIDGLPQVAFSVSKKLFKSAVIRNHIKRKMLESYRLEWRDHLIDIGPQKLVVMWIYIGKTDLDYCEIRSGMVKAMKELNRRVLDFEPKKL
ncbi:MAG: ribonuclease P protein component [Saprospiraceae bacterium]|nr:ribonuclease P protein component [Candidatus Defluviibacterium haderslevense]